MKWAGHVTCMARGEGHTEFWWEELRERHHLEDLGVDGRMIIKWIFNE